MLRSAVLGAAMLAIATPAFASGFTFETAKPVDEDRFATLGTVWLCEDTVCKGDLKRKKVSVRDCKKLAKKVGEIVSFKNGDAELTAEELEECKATARNR